MTSPSSPLRFALLGYGRVAPTHVDAIHALGDSARLVAICDSDPDALAKAVADTDAEGHADLHEMLAREDIDVVSICTPSGLHAQHGISAARAGKHVLVEKPVDVTLEAAQSLLDECHRANVHLFCVFQNRLNTTIQLVKRAIDSGRFGKLYSITGQVYWHRTQEYYDSAPWRGTRAMDGGAFLNQGIHFVDAMRYLMGDVTEVKSMLGTLARDIECEDSGAALFRFQNGALGNLFVTMLGHKDREGSLTLLGEHGFVKIGGVAMNRIEEWSFATPDPEQDALAHDVDYHTKSVYGFGHKAFYREIVQGRLTREIEEQTEVDALRSLDTLLRITDPSE